MKETDKLQLIKIATELQAIKSYNTFNGTEVLVLCRAKVLNDMGDTIEKIVLRSRSSGRKNKKR